MIRNNQKFFNKCHDILAFCVTHKGRCFSGWTKEKLLLYIGFHLLTKTLFLLRDHGKIIACAFAWPVIPEEVYSRYEKKEPQFAWELPNKGDGLFVAEVIGTRKHAKLLFEKAKEVFSFKRVFTFRQTDKLVELTNTMTRF